MSAFKDRAQTIRDQLDRRQFAYLLELMGVQVYRGFKFKLREEKTPSCQIYNGTAYDFGGSKKAMDIIDIYRQVKGVDFKTALEAVEGMLNIIPDEVDTPVAKHHAFTEYENKPIKEGYVQYMHTRIYSPVYATYVAALLDRLMPSMPKPLQMEMVKHFKIGFDSKRLKLFIPVTNAEGAYANGFKYLPDGNPKVKYFYKKERTLFNIEVLKNAPKYLLILEGEKDVINAHAKGKAAVTAGGTQVWKRKMATSIVQACEQYSVAKPKIMILQDHDKAGLKGAWHIYYDCVAVGLEAKVLYWSQEVARYVRSKDQNIKIGVIKHKKSLKKGFDYTDLISS